MYFSYIHSHEKSYSVCLFFILFWHSEHMLPLDFFHILNLKILQITVLRLLTSLETLLIWYYLNLTPLLCQSFILLFRDDEDLLRDLWVWICIQFLIMAYQFYFLFVIESLYSDSFFRSVMQNPTWCSLMFLS